MPSIKEIQDLIKEVMPHLSSFVNENHRSTEEGINDKIERLKTYLDGLDGDTKRSFTSQSVHSKHPVSTSLGAALNSYHERLKHTRTPSSTSRSRSDSLELDGYRTHTTGSVHGPYRADDKQDQKSGEPDPSTLPIAIPGENGSVYLSHPHLALAPDVPYDWDNYTPQSHGAAVASLGRPHILSTPPVRRSGDDTPGTAVASLGELPIPSTPDVKTTVKSTKPTRSWS